VRPARGATPEQLGGSLGEGSVFLRRHPDIQPEHPVEVEEQGPTLRIVQVRGRCDLARDGKRLRGGEIVGDRIGEARAIARHRFGCQVDRRIRGSRGAAQARQATGCGMHGGIGELSLDR